MNAYLFPHGITCTDQPLADYLAVWELNETEAELCRAGAACEYRDGKLIITPAPPVINQPESMVLTKREFLKRITPEEYATIKGAATANAVVDYYWQMFVVAENVDTADADTISGITMMEQAGLLAPGRAAEILA